MSKFLSLQRHAVYVLIAAALFGASAPIAKLLLESRSALSLAALAYCGGGLALGLVWFVSTRIQSCTGGAPSVDPRRNDEPCRRDCCGQNSGAHRALLVVSENAGCECLVAPKFRRAVVIATRRRPV